MTDFQLIETMRWEPDTGIVRQRLHLERLKRSAARLGFPGAGQAEKRLTEVLGMPPLPCRASPPQGGDRWGRLLPESRPGIELPLVGEMSARPTEGVRLARSQKPNPPPRPSHAQQHRPHRCDHRTLHPLPADTVWTVRIAKTRLVSTDPLLRYKTSRRAVYEAARAEYGTDEADEVLLLNERGEPCEGTITSLFVDDGSSILKTPPISRGLLAGVLRTEMICQRKARVQRLTLDDLKGRPVFMGNSLRGLIRANLIWDT
ncbi:aminotransferase class IV family protein [Rhizobium sp. 32-5/1]|uniref:aminotransferase class IV family protein n=1 Tax=Rhizobium sp. 32-5/1 TaxID=3019602 RepID=UPI00240D9E5C|nr:aminotransferase class IV family protein [Rhizobium sp. 32-5/1]WEZ82556.1 aminotransferase class IV family protein [Rhizobium sp. 32-5/1]